MAFEESEALTLRCWDYGETSQVVHLLTRRAGRVHALAKGSKRPKSSFHGPLDVLVLGRAGWYRRPPGALHVLGSFESEDHYPAIRSDLRRYYVACHVLEAVSAATREEQTEEGIFLLATATLRVVERAREPEAVVALFHADLMRLLGFAPRLDVCVVCSRPAAGAPRERISPAKGGFLCETCAVEDLHAFVGRSGTTASLRELFERPFRDSVREGRPNRRRHDVERALRALLRSVLERDLPTLKWIRSPVPNGGQTARAGEHPG